MSLSQAHNSGAYDDTRNRILKWVENAPLAAGEATTEKYIYNGGGDGNPAIGYGYNLAAHTADQDEAALKIALGYLAETPLSSMPQEVQDGLGMLRDWKDASTQMHRLLRLPKAQLAQQSSKPGSKAW